MRQGHARKHHHGAVTHDVAVERAQVQPAALLDHAAEAEMHPGGKRRVHGVAQRELVRIVALERERLAVVPCREAQRGLGAGTLACFCQGRQRRYPGCWVPLKAVRDGAGHFQAFVLHLVELLAQRGHGGVGRELAREQVRGDGSQGAEQHHRRQAHQQAGDDQPVAHLPQRPLGRPSQEQEEEQRRQRDQGKDPQCFGQTTERPVQKTEAKPRRHGERKPETAALDEAGRLRPPQALEESAFDGLEPAEHVRHPPPSAVRGSWNPRPVYRARLPSPGGAYAGTPAGAASSIRTLRMVWK